MGNSEQYEQETAIQYTTVRYAILYIAELSRNKFVSNLLTVIIIFIYHHFYFLLFIQYVISNFTCWHDYCLQ